MDRHLVISSDCHAGLPPERYRDYLDAKYRAAFDQALPIQIEMTREAAKKLPDRTTSTRSGGAGASASSPAPGTTRSACACSTATASPARCIFPDGITEMNMPPFGAGLSLPTENVVPELQWAGARAHNRWLAELVRDGARAARRRRDRAGALGRRRGRARGALGAGARPARRR